MYSGKPGTAQISQGKEGYKVGKTKHQVAFCGYFPYENPLYTCVVVMREPGIGYPSGGHMSGSVFKNIAERVMALRSNRKPLAYEKDTITHYPIKPFTKVGYYEALGTVMADLKLPLGTKSSEWVKTTSDDNKTEVQSVAVASNVVPDLTGMGAKDAVYLLERLGLSVQVQGRGKVISQSIKPGFFAKKGSLVLLNFE